MEGVTSSGLLFYLKPLYQIQKSPHEQNYK